MEVVTTVPAATGAEGAGRGAAEAGAGAAIARPVLEFVSPPPLESLLRPKVAVESPGED